MSGKRQVRLLLVRHTQTFLNAERRYSGAKEVTVLTPLGHEQAFALARRISEMGVAAIYASDLQRTRQVAAHISACCGAMDVVHEARLREVDVGAMGGLTKDEAKERFPAPHFRTSSPDYDFTSIGGEGRQQVIARQLDCFRDILQRHGCDEEDVAQQPVIVLVGHGTSFRTMLQHLGIEPSVLHEQGDFQEVVFNG